MVKRKKLRNQRPKALLGADGAIMAAATLAAAGIQSAAQYYTGKQGADAALEGAKRQADALKAQNENANKLQTEMMQFTKDQNDQSRQIMKDTQMNLQLLAGAQSMHDRREQSKTIVKYGGSKKRKLRDAISSLRGNYNLPFNVTDGGGVIPIGQTPEGFDMYQVVGDTHKQYHKTRGGKYKSGVGFKLPDGSEIEAENNEKLIATPDNLYFLSAHSRHNLNPSKAVDLGMDPVTAYQMQETYKNIDGIDSEGNSTSPIRRYAQFGGVFPYYSTLIPSQTYRLMPGATAVALEQSQMNNRSNSFKNGGSVKKELASLKNRRKLKTGGWWQGPTYNALGNIFGAGISSLGSWLGSNYMSKRVGEASGIMADAYRNLKGVNMSEVFGDNLSASFDLGAYMPALRSSYYSADPWLEEVHRNMRRVQGASANTNGSTAAQLNRLNTAIANSAEETGKIYANKANIEEQNKQQQMAAINEAAAHNAQLKIVGLKNMTGIKADIAKFNAGIGNESILGAADAEANGLMQQGQLKANMWQGIANSFGSAIAQSGAGFASAYNDYLNRKHETNMALLKATPNGEARYYGNPELTSDAEARDYLASLEEELALTTDPRVKEDIIGRINIIKRRFKKVSIPIENNGNTTNKEKVETFIDTMKYHGWN